MAGDDAVVSIRGVSKNYQALRPLRIAELDVHEGQSVAIVGLDATASEVLINLITGSSLPDTGGVTVMGEPTSHITDGDSWLRSLDRFGLLSDRSVLVEQLTVEQNLAMPFTLDFAAMDPRVRANVRALADEVGVSAEELPAPAGAVPPATQLRVRLGRALALRPRLLLAAHPNAALSADDTPGFAADFSRIIAARRLTTLVLTADRTFAHAVAQHVLTHEPATGLLKASAGWRRWFS